MPHTDLGGNAFVQAQLLKGYVLFSVCPIWRERKERSPGTLLKTVLTPSRLGVRLG